MTESDASGPGSREDSPANQSSEGRPDPGARVSDVPPSSAGFSKGSSASGGSEGSPLGAPPPLGPRPGPVYYAPPPPRRRRNGWLWALAIIVALGLMGLFAFAFVVDQFRIASIGGIGGPIAQRDMLREVVIEPSPTRDKILVIDLLGVISSDPWDFMGNNLVTYIKDQLQRAADDDSVKAIVLKIDSPGGEVLASDEIYGLLRDFQEDNDKPVVAAMGTMAASGGYYVAAPCRWIVANELTITGSIGVIMHTYNWRNLMEKVGVRPQVFKSGPLKDMLSPDKREEEITAQERKIVQDLVDETFERFKEVLAEGRTRAKMRNQENEGDEADQGRALAPNWQDYTDGRLLSGKEAWNLGFVDELGNFDTAVERARKLAGIEESKLIQYLRPMGLGSLFRLFGQGEESRVTVDLGLPKPKLRSGLYFIAPELAQ